MPIVLTGLSFDSKKYKPLLSFSTLGCPDWPFEKIVDFAAANNYDGIEFRGIQRELDLAKCPAFSSPQNIEVSKNLLKQNNLKFVDLNASAEMHHPEGDERQKNLAEARRFIDLAQQLGCPYIRVYPNEVLKEPDTEASIQLIVQGLLELGHYASDKNVIVLMETHCLHPQRNPGSVFIANLQKIMEQAEHPHVGLVWDPYNMWTVTKESPMQAYAALKKYIRHAHIKDGKFSDGKYQYVLFGEGDTPIFEAVDSLAKDHYSGCYSFEWEKLWHPEISEGEIALADYPKKMKRHFEGLKL